MFNNLGKHMLNIRSKLSLIIILTSSVILSGCWDNRDVTEISFSTALGADKAPDGKLEMTIEIAKSQKQQAQGGDSEKKSVFIVSSQGDTLFIAGRSMVEKLKSQVYPTKQVLCLVSEELAQEGLMQVLDFLERDPEANITAQMVVVRGAPMKKVMEAQSQQEKITSLHIAKTITINQDAFGTSKEARIIDVLRDIGSYGKDPLLPIIQIDQEDKELKAEEMSISGSAAFRGDKLVGFLTDAQTRGWLLASDKGKKSVYSVPSPNTEDKKMSFEMYSSTGKIDVKMIEGKPKLTITAKVSGDIGESQESTDLTKPEVLAKLRAEVAKVIKGEIESALTTSQEYKADVFGFGEVIHRKYSAEWQKMQYDWNEIFSKAPYEINVEVKIKRSGYIRERTEPR